MDDLYTFIANAMSITDIETKVYEFDESVCALSGVAITSGCKTWDVVPKVAGEFLDLLPNGFLPYVSTSVAKVFSKSWNLGSRAFINTQDGEWIHHHPLIARSTEQSRSCWSDLLRSLRDDHRGDEAVIILASDPKKRVFPKARITTIGSSTTILVHDSSQALSQLVTVDIDALIECLDLIEEVYSIEFEALSMSGFTKQSIGVSLLAEYNKAMDIGLAETLRYESALSLWRTRPEFSVAVIVAQKNELLKRISPKKELTNVTKKGSPKQEKLF